MKIRADFVTNSSSSSFILARKSKLNEKQKEKIIRFVETELLGRETLSPDSSEKEISDAFEENWEFHDEDCQREIRNALSQGKSIYSGYVMFDESDYSLSDIYETLWRILEEDEEENFTIIDGDLSY